MGFFLILAVFAVTLGRAGFFSKSENKEEVSRKNVSDQEELEKRKIIPEDLSQKIISDDAPVVVDIRDSDSYETEHIADSINIPQADLLSSLAALDKSKAYVLMDQSGGLAVAGLAKEIEEKELLTDVYYLSGGFSEWKNGYNPTVSFGDPTSLTDQSKVHYIESDDLFKMISSEDSKKFFLVDLRLKEDFLAGHIKGSINIPIDELEKRRHEIPSGKKTILVDGNGVGAFLGAVRLFDLGIMNVSSLSDGLDAWKEKKYELVK